MGSFIGDASDRDQLLHELTPQQSKALEALDSGATHTDTAALVGVDRTTVSRWTRRHPAFVAELNRRKVERAERTRNQVEEVTMKAIRLIGEAIGDGDVKAALSWIRSSGVAGVVDTEAGPLTVDEFIEHTRQTMVTGREDAFESEDIGGRTRSKAVRLLMDALGEQAGSA